jgi:hypothetical protein
LAFKPSYGGTLSEDGKYLNWRTGKDGAGDRCERCQILSPYRSRALGTVEINRHIKRTLRTRDLHLAFRYEGWRNPKPIGPEQIVCGDKMIQNRNSTRRVRARVDSSIPTRTVPVNPLRARSSSANPATSQVTPLDRRTYSPVLRQADLPPTVTVPWWGDRRLRCHYA